MIYENTIRLLWLYFRGFIGNIYKSLMKKLSEKFSQQVKGKIPDDQFDELLKEIQTTEEPQGYKTTIELKFPSGGYLATAYVISPFGFNYFRKEEGGVEAVLQREFNKAVYKIAERLLAEGAYNLKK